MTITQIRPPATLEFWMELKDRELLRELIEEQISKGTLRSKRELSAFAGWKSHTYLQRLLKDDGPKTLETDPAIRIAFRLGVPVHRLFATRMSGESAQTVQRKAPAA